MATTEVPTESQECDVCGGSHQTEYCPVLGLAVSRARLTLPEGMQIIEMTGGSLGISSKVAISPQTLFGPFEAKRTNCDIEAIDFFILKMFNKDGSITCYDASDENECNWMCFIRPADTSEEQNCMAYRIGQNVFYSVTREIQPEEELRVWYAPHYAKKLGRDPCPNGATRTMLGALLITEQPEPAMRTEPREEEEGEGEGEGTEEGTEEKPVPIHRKNITESQSPENINRLEQDKASKITHENRKVGSTNNSLAKTPQKAMVTKTPETNREEQDLRATNVGGTNSLAGTQQNTIETQTPVKRSRGRPPKSKNKRPNFHYVPAETVDPVPILPDIKVGDSSGRRILPHRAVKGVRTTGKLAENDDSFLSPRKAKGGKVPSQGHQKKGRGRPRKLDVDSEVGQIGGEDDGKDSDGVEDGEEEVMGDEEEEEFVDDAEDADFKPPNRIKKNEEEEEDEENEIDEQDENLEDEDTYKERSRGKTPHKKRQRRKMKDEEILALEELTSVTYSEEGEKLYNCGKCGKQFTQRSYLRLHLPAHTDRYKCKDCCKRFARNESLQKHKCLKTKQILYMKEKQQESDPDIYCCAHCHKEFTQENYVIKHFSQHTSKLKCPQCGVLFPAEGDLAKHLETECQKSTEKEFPCTISKQSFKCEKCGKCYPRKDSWQTHMLRCMPESLEKHQIFVCTNCKKTFATKLGANNHMANCARHFCQSKRQPSNTRMN